MEPQKPTPLTKVSKLGLHKSSKHFTVKDINEVALLLKKGKIGVVPSDTVYGLMASAFKPDAIQRINDIKNRPNDKKMIVLINSADDMKQFGISDKDIELAKKHWPGATSVIVSCTNDRFNHLTKGTTTFALRLPEYNIIRKIIQISGPLVAPSANPGGLPPATTINEAAAYFGNEIDFYLDGGVRNKQPSKIIDISEDNQKVIRH